MFERMSATELARLIHQKEAKPSEICKAFLARAKELEPKINAFTALETEAVLAQAEVLDAVTITEDTPVLFGLPFAVKDNICTADMPTTCASKMLRNFCPPYDATAVARLREQGALLVGKTNMDEFAMGPNSESSIFGRTYNPHDLRCSPGGSSGGSAAAVAAGMVPLSLGTDMGGSIRKPASFCGLVGYKPSYGAVSRHGLITASGSFDQIGPICRTVSDVALLTAAIAGYDALDSMSNPQFVSDFSGLETFYVKGKTVGIVKELFGEGVSDDVRAAILATAKVYESLGARVVEISIPELAYSLPVYHTIAMAEASSNLAKLDGVRFGHRSESASDVDSLYINSRTEGFGDEVKRRILIGTYLLSAGNYELYYKKARVLWGMLREAFQTAFETCDFLLTPAAPKTAPVYGQKETDPAVLYVNSICTSSMNIAGLPALSVPCGIDSEGLPIGAQLVGRRFADADLLGLARVFERESGFSNPVAEVK
ncbi:MAG: Asp-tRNA(Asn)/Glu-tRNA(Gln) amidotransferase subunit GatA [Oscillospiraceae bacterium]|nr:Asp-tRNA(Asn)/Glu-tRNA(Gln) amidotransferase subunit GatA [Oscillospiraceae bacterium]